MGGWVRDVYGGIGEQKEMDRWVDVEVCGGEMNDSMDTTPPLHTICEAFIQLCGILVISRLSFNIQSPSVVS